MGIAYLRSSVSFQCFPLPVCITTTSALNNRQCCSNNQTVSSILNDPVLRICLSGKLFQALSYPNFVHTVPAFERWLALATFDPSVSPYPKWQ